MSLRLRLVTAVSLLVAIAAAGTVSYMWIEELRFLDAFYLTVITISTVGFEEPAGGFTRAGEMATIVLIVIGVGTVFYTATTALEFAMEQFLGGTMQVRRSRRRIERMHNHVIICGYGRIGRHVWEILEAGERPVVVIDSEERHAQAARDAGLPVVELDATDDVALEEAGIDRAEVLIASVRTDPDNVAIVLSARARRPDLRIIARANEPQAEKKLLLAGADRVVTPAVVGAERMASMVEKPDLTDFIDLQFHGDLVELRVEEFLLDADSRMVGRTLSTSEIREGSGAMVIAVVTRDGNPILNPPADFWLRAGQIIVAIGTEEQLTRLRKLVTR